MSALPAALAALVLTSSLTLSGSTPASAAPDRCVSNVEFTQVKKRMTVPRVKQVVGFNGRFDKRLVASQDFVLQKRHYRLCSSPSKVAELTYVSVRGGPFKLTRKEKVAR